MKKMANFKMPRIDRVILFHMGAPLTLRLLFKAPTNNTLQQSQDNCCNITILSTVYIVEELH